MVLPPNALRFGQRRERGAVRARRTTGADARAASGPALEVCDLFGLAVGALLGARQLVLGLALALLHASLAARRRAVREVSHGLLGAAGDLVRDAHVSRASCSGAVVGLYPSVSGRETGVGA